MVIERLFHNIYIASRDSLSRIVGRIVPPHEIEDIVQETYVRICQIENKERITSPKSFMFKTARNLALDYIKQANIRLVDSVENNPTLNQMLDNTNSDEMFESAFTHSQLSHFCEAVRQLPVQCRKVFVLKKVYGYSQREIAQQLNISESTVEKHISTGLKKCTLFMRSIGKNSGKTAAKPSRNFAGGSNE